jgi:hypothetical protein
MMAAILLFVVGLFHLMQSVQSMLLTDLLSLFALEDLNSLQRIQSKMSALMATQQFNPILLRSAPNYICGSENKPNR